RSGKHARHGARGKPGWRRPGPCSRAHGPSESAGVVSWGGSRPPCAPRRLRSSAPRDPCREPAMATLFAVTDLGLRCLAERDGALESRLLLEDRRLQCVAVHPREPGRIFAGSRGRGVWRSDDGGSSWRELDALRRLPSASTWSFPPRPWTSHVRWIAPNPHDAGLLLAGIELGGLMRSTDRGET